MRRCGQHKGDKPRRSPSADRPLPVPVCQIGVGLVFAIDFEQVGQAEHHKERQDGAFTELLDKFIPYQTYHGAPSCNSTRTHPPGWAGQAVRS